MVPCGAESTGLKSIAGPVTLKTHNSYLPCCEYPISIDSLWVRQRFPWIYSSMKRALKRTIETHCEQIHGKKPLLKGGWGRACAWPTAKQRSRPAVFLIHIIHLVLCDIFLMYTTFPVLCVCFLHICFINKNIFFIEV